MSVKTVHDGILNYFQNHPDFIAEFGVNEIKKGALKKESISKAGKIFRVMYSKSIDNPDEQQEIGYTEVKVTYGFLLCIGFNELDSEVAEDKKAGYDKMIRDAIDQDLSLGGSVMETTKMLEITFAESIEVEGLYFSDMPLIVENLETVKNR